MISTTYCMDNMEGMRKFPNKYFDWVLDDIPYGISVGTMPYIKKSKKIVRQKSGKSLKINKTDYERQYWDEKVPSQAYFDELVRVSQNQLIFGIEYTNWTGVGLGRFKWDKCVPDGMSFSRYEVAYCSAIDYVHEFQLLHSGMRQAKSLAEPTTQQGNKRLNEKRIHICQKPVLLWDYILLKLCKPGMKILSPHMGSQGDRISCDKFGIAEFVGFENNLHNYQAGEKRWANYKKQYSIQF